MFKKKKKKMEPTYQTADKEDSDEHVGGENIDLLVHDLVDVDLRPVDVKTLDLAYQRKLIADQKKRQVNTNLRLITTTTTTTTTKQRQDQKTEDDEDGGCRCWCMRR